jgi:hypothetical protein
MLAGDWQMPPDALQRLNKVSQLPLRYPRSMEDPMPERRNSAIKMPTLQA